MLTRLSFLQQSSVGKGSDSITHRKSNIFMNTFLILTPNITTWRFRKQIRTRCPYFCKWGRQAFPVLGTSERHVSLRGPYSGPTKIFPVFAACWPFWPPQVQTDHQCMNYVFAQCMVDIVVSLHRCVKPENWYKIMNSDKIAQLFFFFKLSSSNA